jgi:hypothetical protein
MDRLSRGDGRRDFLKGIGVKLVQVVPLAMLVNASHASKANKGDFFFQERPKNGKRCADCRLFMRDGQNTNLGTCTVVEGVISADGWCMAYTPK